ncbi:NUBP iron-sulfur cluster assembly factor, mitochondrial [Brevipalpus obovatus]|uniref:NUBP iron-sulfur cluster assembly factor, mitochondrial n=1 Tax=Brevipalpus obovatus TaxID=246614 RepID=UPI003D9E95BB
MVANLSKIPLAGVGHVILVSSAKGGVGKSTVAVNLAIALKNIGREKKVGLLDADIYGPSLPKMMNLRVLPEINRQSLMIPPVNFGIHCMSMGFLVKEGDALTWRGPIVMSAVQKLLRGVLWGPLDYLVIDMPPGTGDVQISISQNIPVSGAVIVTTPQEIALLDARKGITMFRNLKIKVIGIVENMSVFVCEKCNHQTHIFGKDGARNLAQESETCLLGTIPLNKFLRETCDEGKPLMAFESDLSLRKAFTDVASNLIENLPPPLT